MKTFFISYASKEIKKAKEICQVLESNNVKCFVAERDIRPGQEYAGEIIEGLKNADAVVLLLSRESNASPHVLREVEYAVSHHINLITFQLEEVELSKSMEYFLMASQWVVFGENQNSRLLEAIGAVEHKESDETKLKKTNARLKGILVAAAALIILLMAAIIVLFCSNQEETTDSKTDVGPITETVREYKLGDTFVLGNYNGAPIEWRIIKLNDDNTAVAVSKYILTVKAFDTAEGGKYNEYEGVDYYSFENHIVTDDNLNVLIRGNNEWRLSNIRTWLNSDAEMVNYEDQAPTRKATCCHVNDYSEEPGFLYAFTDAEKDSLVLTKNLTLPNRLSAEVSADGFVESEDYVYLLSAREVEWIRQAGISYYTTATDEAIEKDESHEIKTYQEMYDSFWYWTRDPKEDSVERGVLVNVNDSSDELFDYSNTVGAACFGIRPAVTVDLETLPDKKD